MKDLKSNGQPRPPAVDEIKIFDNDDKAAKHLHQGCLGWDFTSFCRKLY